MAVKDWKMRHIKLIDLSIPAIQRYAFSEVMNYTLRRTQSFIVIVFVKLIRRFPSPEGNYDDIVNEITES